jgi:formyl-CoA transferase
VFADPQVKHLGIATPVESRKLGRKHVLANAAVLSRTPARVVAPTPEIGEHTDEILQELKYDATEIAKLRQGGVV